MHVKENAFQRGSQSRERTPQPPSTTPAAEKAEAPALNSLKFFVGVHYLVGRAISSVNQVIYFSTVLVEKKHPIAGLSIEREEQGKQS